MRHDFGVRKRTQTTIALIRDCLFRIPSPKNSHPSIHITIHYFLIEVEYTRKVCANYLVYLTTLTTCILARTHSTVAVYAEESDVDDGDEEISDSV
jgi:hypothetical protein